MIVCRRCSRHHPDGTEFCVCGAYLEFDGERVSEAASPPTIPLPPPAEHAAGRRPATGSAPTEAEPAPWSGFEPAGRETGPAGGIDAVLPDAPVQTGATEPVWVDGGGRAGDLPCRQCGTPNGPERMFCRHCGAALTGAVDLSTTPPPRRTPWWRKVFARGRSKVGSADPAAMMGRVHGLARGGLSGRTRLFRAGGVMIVLAGLLAFLGPWRGPVLARARTLIGADRHEAIDVGADEVESVATDPAVEPALFDLQGPGNVVDRFANTAWATLWLDPLGTGFETPPEDDTCQPVPMTDSQLVFEFDEPLDIARIRILGGRPDDEGRTLFRRPRVLELEIGDRDCSYVELEDVGELVDVAFDHDDVETLAIRIVGVHEADAPGEMVEISEIVFEE